MSAVPTKSTYELVASKTLNDIENISEVKASCSGILVATESLEDEKCMMLETKTITKPHSEQQHSRKRRCALIRHISWFQVAVCGFSAISGFLLGYDLCVMVVALPLIQTEFLLSTGIAQAVVSILMVGAVFGSLVGGMLADRIGRKPAIMATAACFWWGSVCMTFAPSIHVVLIGRFLAGLAVGSSGPIVSTYLSEIAEPQHRGALVSINEVMLCFGCFVSVIVSSSLKETNSGWRKMLGVTLVPPLIQLIGMPILPESPRWLLAQNDQIVEAKAVLRRLFPRSHGEIYLSQYANGCQRKGNIWLTLRMIWDDKVDRQRVVLSLSIALAHTFTGANGMLYYSTYILKSLDSNNHNIDNFNGALNDGSKEIGVAIAKLAGVCVAVFLVDKVGRRPLILAGSIVMLISDVIFAVCFMHLNNRVDLEVVGMWNLYMFIFAWNVSWAPLMWVICSEILSNDLRSVGMGLTFAVFWLGSSLVNQTLLTLFHVIGMTMSFLLYATLTTVSLVFMYSYVPETSTLSFEEISELFSEP